MHVKHNPQTPKILHDGNTVLIIKYDQRKIEIHMLLYAHIGTGINLCSLQELHLLKQFQAMLQVIVT